MPAQPRCRYKCRCVGVCTAHVCACVCEGESEREREIHSHSDYSLYAQALYAELQSTQVFVRVVCYYASIPSAQADPRRLASLTLSYSLSLSLSLSLFRALSLSLSLFLSLSHSLTHRDTLHAHAQARLARVLVPPADDGPDFTASPSAVAQHLIRNFTCANCICRSWVRDSQLYYQNCALPASIASINPTVISYCHSCHLNKALGDVLNALATLEVRTDPNTASYMHTY